MTTTAWYESLLNALSSRRPADVSQEQALAQRLVVQQAYQKALEQNPAASLSEALWQLLQREIDQLKSTDEVGYQILQARFIEQATVRGVALALYLSEDSVQRRQRTAIEQMATSLAAQEEALMAKSALSLESALQPPTYNRLFGIEAIAQSLADRLIKPDGAWITLVTGIGGIGKTAVADYAVRRAIRQGSIEHLLWMRCESPTLTGQSIVPDGIYQQLMIALSELPHISAGALPPTQRDRQVWQALKSASHLIIIDNVEEATETAAILERLPQLTDPSRFLLTARGRPLNAAMAFAQPLDELSLTYSKALLRYEATSTNIPALAEADDTQLESLCLLVGGNPLALKITAGLARIMPLSAIQAELKQGRAGPVEDMYRRIYWQAWRALSQPARALLPAMLLVGEVGARPEQLQAVSQLDEQELWPTIRELTACSLMETRGTLSERRYGIHRLTATFLQTEIVKWSE